MAGENASKSTGIERTDPEGSEGIPQWRSGCGCLQGRSPADYHGAHCPVEESGDVMLDRHKARVWSGIGDNRYCCATKNGAPHAENCCRRVSWGKCISVPQADKPSVIEALCNSCGSRLSRIMTSGDWSCDVCQKNGTMTLYVGTVYRTTMGAYKFIGAPDNWIEIKP